MTRGISTFLSIALFAATLATTLLPQTAFAWGRRAHGIINRTAVDSLPADGPVFLREHRDDIGELSTLPDTWRNTSEPFSKIEEDPNHGWFREQFAFMKPVPRSRYAFVLALHDQYLAIRDKDPAAAARTNVRWTGTLPFAVMETYGKLVSCMRQVRERSAKSENAKALERACAFHASQLGHYIGDGSQPMHNSIHSDGWRGDNPHDYTRDRSVHGRVETTFVDSIALEDAAIQRRMPAVGHDQGDLFELVLAYLNESGDLVDTLYKLEKRGAFEGAGTTESRELIEQRVTAGAAMLRDLLQRAWVESGRPPVKPALDPLDAANPAYDGATGSAPAHRQR